MKLISKCEREFVSNCIIKRQKRVDGRELLQGRTIEIVFGKERGCCMVLQGSTRVLVQVSCDITEPKPSTPSEGIIHVNLEFSAMASPDAKNYLRSSEEFVEAQRAIERCIRDSKCIDLESLCIISASKVWTIRVDIHALNDDGNLAECTTIAAISALAHFRRPEVTVIGNDVTVHSVEEKKPVSLNLHHMPISINLALFDQGKYIVVDPNEMEEKVCDGCYIIGMNAHQEVCFVHRRGVLLMKLLEIQQCEDVAVKRAQEVTQIIRKALDNDEYNRKTNAPVGFTNLIQTATILGAKRQIAEVSVQSVQEIHESSPVEVEDIQEDNEEPEEQVNGRIGRSSQMRSAAKERAMHILQESEEAVFEGGRSKWAEDTDEEEEDSEVEDIPVTKPDISPNDEEINIDSDSEEETVYVSKDELDVKPSTSRGWFSRDPFM